MWLGEKITDKGIGNGVSLLIMVGILSRLPQAFIFEFDAQMASSGLIIFILELAALFLIITYFKFFLIRNSVNYSSIDRYA